jgi:hypothetical protein
MLFTIVLLFAVFTVNSASIFFTSPKYIDLDDQLLKKLLKNEIMHDLEMVRLLEIFEQDLENVFKTQDPTLIAEWRNKTKSTQKQEATINRMLNEKFFDKKKAENETEPVQVDEESLKKEIKHLKEENTKLTKSLKHKSQKLEEALKQNAVIKALADTKINFNKKVTTPVMQAATNVYDNITNPDGRVSKTIGEAKKTIVDGFSGIGTTIRDNAKKVNAKLNGSKDQEQKDPDQQKESFSNRIIDGFKTFGTKVNEKTTELKAKLKNNTKSKNVKNDDAKEKIVVATEEDIIKEDKNIIKEDKNIIKKESTDIK